MTEKRRKFTPEFKDEAVKMVIESGRQIAEVAREIHVNPGTLGNWCAKYRENHPEEEEVLSISERARLREFETEVRELRMKNEFLGKVFDSAGAEARSGLKMVVRSPADVVALWSPDQRPWKSRALGAAA